WAADGGRAAAREPRVNEAGPPPGRRTGPATAGIAPGNGKATDRMPIRAVVIDDSPAQRTRLVRILQADGDIEVVGLATSSWAAGDEAQLRRCLRSLHKVGVVHSPCARPAGSAAPSVSLASVTSPIVALAASTGGPPALAEVLSGLGGLDAPVLVVQHIHPDFVPGLVTWMSRACPLPVELARHGATALPGRVYIAGGGLHLRLDARRRLVLSALPVTIHRPSADELLRSVAEHAGAAAIGAV